MVFAHEGFGYQVTPRRLSPRSHSASRKRTDDATGPPKQVRVTVDLAPDDYDTLRDWAHTERMSHSDVLRALVRLLLDETVASAVRDYEAKR